MRFQNFINRIKSPVPDVDSERRMSWRINRKVVLFGYRKGGEKIQLTTVNLGPGGMRVHSGVGLKAGEELRIQPPDSQSVDDSLSAKVIWCRRGRNGSSFDAGMSFDRPGEYIPLPLEGLLEACGVRLKSGREQRKAPRVGTLRLNGFLYTMDDQVNAVEVHDLAVGGALVLSTRRLPLETPLHLRVTLDEHGDFESAGKVVRVRDSETAGLALLGIAFTTIDARQRDRLTHYLARHLKEG